MKWKIPEHGETRVIRQFAILPTRYKGNVYWLERFYKQQYYDRDYHKWVIDYDPHTSKRRSHIFDVD